MAEPKSSQVDMRYSLDLDPEFSKFLEQVSRTTIRDVKQLSEKIEDSKKFVAADSNLLLEEMWNCDKNFGSFSTDIDLNGTFSEKTLNAERRSHMSKVLDSLRNNENCAVLNGKHIINGSESNSIAPSIEVESTESPHTPLNVAHPSLPHHFRLGNANHRLKEN